MQIFVFSDNMWTYLEDVNPPQKRKTPEEKATYFRDYDKNKRTRSYLNVYIDTLHKQSVVDKIVGSSSGRINFFLYIKLVFTGSTLNMQHKGVRVKTGWLRFRKTWSDKSTRRLV